VVGAAVVVDVGSGAFGCGDRVGVDDPTPVSLVNTCSTVVVAADSDVPADVGSSDDAGAVTGSVSDAATVASLVPPSSASVDACSSVP
jgi:hypothetical protein